MNKDQSFMLTQTGLEAQNPRFKAEPQKLAFNVQIITHSNFWQNGTPRNSLEESPISNQSDLQARAQRSIFKNPNSLKVYDQDKR